MSVAGFVRTWSRSLQGAACLPMLPAERDQLLAGFADRIAAALSTGPFDPVQGQRIGADLVAAGFATPEVLGRTIATVTDHLVGDLALPEPAGDRLTGLVDALACGFATAVRDRALDAQETVITVALTARARAEQALRASEARALHLATHDPVTGLPNRTVLTGRLSAFAATARPGARLGVCCIDLDRFAAVNHTLGHPAGNRLLVAVADRLRTLAAGAGALVARLEGDQFAILIEHTTSSEDAVKVADRALTRLAGPFHVDDVELPLTASAGVAEGTATDAVGLVQAAQIALHWAKADGRAQWRLYQQQRADADTARYRLSAAMPGALRRGEFTLDYQPLVDLAGGGLVGAEALARWRHPELGRLPAHRFIDLAEHTGLVVPLGNRLLAEACRQAAKWREPRPYVSVNLAAAQLHDPGFVGYVAQTLDHTGLSPDRLQLEITERAVIDPDRVSGTLAALVGLGVRLAIDDFGTAYSNLIRLRDLPLSTLKLDGALVPRGDADRHDGFLATVVELGHTLGLSVTAEGIETADDAQRMREAGCDTGQGWHLGYPVPADELRLSA